MNNFKSDIIKESPEKLLSVIKTIKKTSIYLRVRLLYLLKTKQFPTIALACKSLDISYSSGKKYIKIYKDKGLSGLMELHYKGRIPKLTEQELAELVERSKEGFSSLKEIQQWIKENFGKEVSIQTVSRICQNLNIKKKKVDQVI